MINWKKWFLIVGVPLLGFFIFLTVIFFSFLATVLIWALILGIASLNYKKKKIWPSLLKLSIAVNVVFVVFIANPVYWPRQIYHRLNPMVMLTPDHPSVTNLNSTDMMWKYINDTKGINQSAFVLLTDDEKLELMTDYVLEEVVTYKFLHEIYGVFAYMANAPEVIAHGEGDCHSRTMVMVSLFIHLGYDAYACETPLHWYTMVNLAGVPHYYYRINWSDPTFMFNDQKVVYRLNPLMALMDVVFHKSLNEIGYTLQAPIAWLPILPIAFFALGSLFTVISKSPEKLNKKDFLKNSLMTTVVLLTGTLLAMSLFQLFSFIPLFIMLMSIVVSMRLLHEDYFFKKEIVNKKKEKSSE